MPHKMTSPTTQLSDQDRSQLVTPERLDFGAYRSGVQNRDEHEFVMGLDACPLAALIDSAFCGSRVYELMSITRPADVLHYLYLTYIDVDQEVLTAVEGHLKFRYRFSKISIVDGIAFTEFDNCFAWGGDDTEPYEENWLRHRESGFWNQKMHALLSLVKEMQQRIRHMDDFLIQHEISLIDRGVHRRDFLPQIERHALLTNKANTETTLPPSLYEAIATLIKSDKVRSVSCPLHDYQLWRLMVQEQIRRALAGGQELQEALYLSSGDGGLSMTGSDGRRYPKEPQDWGGNVHVPYEGAREGDLFIAPHWYVFDRKSAEVEGSLEAGLNYKKCRYMLTKVDFGELGCATRTQVGEWVLYEDNGA